MLNKINLADIRSFVLIVQTGNFTRAAEMLGVSRSHVSRQVTQLEKDLGVTLLLRTTRSIKLTNAGRQLFAQSESALAQLEQALLNTLDTAGDLRGQISVNCVGGYLGEEIIVPMINGFMARYPGITVSLDFSSHRVDLIRDEFDVAFRMGKLEDAGFVARKLLDVEMRTLASPGYLKNASAIKHPRELEQHRCLTGSVNKWRYVHADSQESVEVQVGGSLKCKNGRALIDGALQGIGIVRVPSLYCEAQLQAGKLVDVFSDWQIPSVDFSMIYHKDKFRPARMTQFIEYMLEQFDGLERKGLAENLE